MDCPRCMVLEQALECKLSKYTAARSAAVFRVSTQLAAWKMVDMERARNDLEEHQLTCLCAQAANAARVTLAATA
jgi:hypothetical protein